jgi:hypothetical protein
MWQHYSGYSDLHNYDLVSNQKEQDEHETSRLQYKKENDP